MQCLVILLTFVSCGEFVNSLDCSFPFGRPCLPTSSNSSKSLKLEKNRSETMEINTWRPKSERQKNSDEETLRSSNFNKELRPRGADGYSLHANDFSSLELGKDVEKKFRIRFQSKGRNEVPFGNAAKFLFVPRRKFEGKRIYESEYMMDSIFNSNNETQMFIGVEGKDNLSDIGEAFISENIIRTFSTKKLDERPNASKLLESNLKYYVPETSFQKFKAGGLEKHEEISTIEHLTEVNDLSKFSRTSSIAKGDEISNQYTATTEPVTINDNKNSPNSKQGDISRLLIRGLKLHLKKTLTDFQSERMKILGRCFVKLNSYLNQTSCTNKKCGNSSRTSSGMEHNLLFKSNLGNRVHTQKTSPETLNYDNTTLLPNVRDYKRNLVFKFHKPFTYAEYSGKKTKLYPIESPPQFKGDLKSRPISDNTEMVVDEALKSYQTGTIAGDKVTDLLLRRNEGTSVEDDFAPRSSDETRKKSELQIYEESSFDKDSGALKMETGSGDQLRKDIREKRQNGKQYIYRRLNDLFGRQGNLERSFDHTESLRIGKSLKRNDKNFTPLELSSVQPMTLGTFQDGNIPKSNEMFASNIHGASEGFRNFSAAGKKLNDILSIVSDTSLPMRLQTFKKKELLKLEQHNVGNINRDPSSKLLSHFNKTYHFDRNTLEDTIPKNNKVLAPSQTDSLNSIIINSRSKRQSGKITQDKNHVRNSSLVSLDQTRRWEDALVLVIDKSALPIAVRTQNNDYTRTRDHSNVGYNSETRVPGTYHHFKTKDNSESVTSDLPEYKDKPRYLNGHSVSNSGGSQRTSSRPKSPSPHSFRQNVDNGSKWKKVGITSVVDRNRQYRPQHNGQQDPEYAETDIFFGRPKSRLKSWFETKVLKGNLKSSRNLPNSNGKEPSEIWYIILPIEKGQENPSNDNKQQLSISVKRRASLKPKYDEINTQIAPQRELENEDPDEITRVGPRATTYGTPRYIYPKNTRIYPMSRGVKRNKPNLQQFERYIGIDQLEMNNDTDQKRFVDWFNSQWGFVTPTDSTPVEKSTKDPSNATVAKFPNKEFTTFQPDFQLTVKDTNHLFTANYPNSQPTEEEERRNRYTTPYTEERHTATNTSDTVEMNQTNGTKLPDSIQRTNVPESIQSRKMQPSKIPGNKLNTKSPKRSSTTKSTTPKPPIKTVTTRKPSIVTTKKPENIVNKPMRHDPWWNGPHDPWWDDSHDPWWNGPHDPWWNTPNRKPWKKPIPCSKGFVPSNPWKIWKRPPMTTHGMKGGD